MSGLAQIRRHTWHIIGASSSCVAGVSVQDLQSFAAGYIPLPDQSILNLVNFIWGGRKRYNIATDTLTDTPGTIVDLMRTIRSADRRVLDDAMPTLPDATPVARPRVPWVPDPVAKVREELNAQNDRCWGVIQEIVTRWR